MIKLYLDTCAIQRPIDALNQTRLRLEAEAILGVTGFGNYTEERRALIEGQTLEKIWSDLQSYQAQRTPREQDRVATYA